MSISSGYPVSADQIYAALVAMGAEPVLDPELWPEGPQEGNRRRLLGVLLAKVELEITAATRLGSGHEEDEGEVLLGWIDQVGHNSRLSSNVLVNRLQRTGVQLLGLEEDETPPGCSASAMAIAAAADTFDAHLHFQDGDVEGVRQALGRAETSVIEILQSMHDLRVVIGDVAEKPDE